MVNMTQAFVEPLRDSRLSVIEHYGVLICTRVLEHNVSA